MIDEKDIDALTKRFDDRYRKIDECNDIVSVADQRQDRLELKFAEGITKLNILIGILSAIAVPIVGIFINTIFGG